MFDYDKYTHLLQWPNGVELFDYNPVIDWALDKIQNGIETENILILASFSKPVDREEIKPYVSAVLKEINLDEKVSEYSIVSNCYYHVQQIIDKYEIRKNLSALYSIHLDNNYPEFTAAFYLLYHSWKDLESEGVNYYYEGATIDNISSILKLEGLKFIEVYINKEQEKILEIESRLNKAANKNIEKQSNFWSNSKRIRKK